MIRTASRLVVTLIAGSALLVACSGSSGTTADTSAAASESAPGSASAAPSQTDAQSGAVPEVLRITNTSCSCFIPAMVAIKEGFLAEEMDKLGVAVEVQNYEDGPSQTAALLSNSLDIAQYGTVGFASLIDRGAPVMSFYVSDLVKETEGLVAKEATEVADLKGKTIGVLQGTTSDFGLGGALETAGLSKDDVTVLNLAPPAMLSAWESGDIDAAYVWDPFLTQLVDAGGSLIQSFGALGDLTEQRYRSMNMYLVSDEFANAYPDVVSAYARALNRATEFTMANPDQVAESLYKELGAENADVARRWIDGEVFFTSAEQSEWLGSEGQEGELVPLMTDTWQFGVDAGNLSETPDAAVVASKLTSKFVTE